MQIDDTDRRILRQLLADPGVAVADLADRAGVTAATGLAAAGAAEGNRRPDRPSVIDWRKLGWAVEVSLRFTLDKTNPVRSTSFLDAARAVPEVIEIQTFLGRVDLRLNVIARDMGHQASTATAS
jgi:Lrp/AsnC family transcriptional regulator